MPGDAICWEGGRITGHRYRSGDLMYDDCDKKHLIPI
jgi:hypothetical protein